MSPDAQGSDLRPIVTNTDKDVVVQVARCLRVLQSYPAEDFYNFRHFTLYISPLGSSSCSL